MARRSALRGIGRVRRLLRGMEEQVRVELADALDQGGQAILAQMRGRTPKRTGKLAAGLEYKVLRKSLRLNVGLIGTPKGRAKLFYGRILDLGRNEQFVTVQRRRVGAPKRTVRGHKVAADIGATYRMHVKRIAPMRFITGRYTELRVALRDQLGGVWNRAMLRLGGYDGD